MNRFSISLKVLSVNGEKIDIDAMNIVPFKDSAGPDYYKNCDLSNCLETLCDLIHEDPLNINPFIHSKVNGVFVDFYCDSDSQDDAIKICVDYLKTVNVESELFECVLELSV